MGNETCNGVADLSTPHIQVALYQSLLQNPTLGFWVVDEHGRFLQVNDAYLHRSGYTRQELMALNVSALKAPDMKNGLTTHQQRIKEQGHHQFESLHRTKGGELWPVEVHATYLRQQGYYLAIIQDITDRKETKEALRKSEAQLDGIFASVMDAIVSTDEKQRIIFFNSAAEEMFGYTADEVIGQDHNMLIPPRFHDIHPQHMDRFGATGHTHRAMGNFETLWGRRANGEEFPLEVSISQVKIEGNRFFTAIIRDITRRKRAEQALEEMQEMLSQTETIAQIGSWKWDLATQDLTWSAEMYKLFGLDPTNDALNLSQIIQERIHPDDRAAVEQSNASARERYQPIPLEYRVVLPDGTERVVWAEGRIVCDESGQPTELVGYVQNITERKQVEEALRASEERYHSTLNNMLEGCQIIGFDWRYLYVNDSVARHGRRTVAELLGKTMMEVYPGIENTELFAILDRCMTGRTPHVMENKFEYDEGAYAWFDLSIQPVPEGLSILSIDITKRKEAVEALHRSEERFSKAFHLSPAALSLTREDGTILDVNESYEQLTGYSRDELLDHDATKLGLFTSEQRADLRQKLRAAGNRLRKAEITIRNKAGELRHVLYSVETIEIEGQPSALTLALDITQRKQMEMALREMTTNMAVAQGMTHSGSWQIQLSPTLEFLEPHIWSDECYRIFGLEPGSVPITTELFYSHVHPDDLARVKGVIDQLFQTQDEVEYEYRLIRLDGTVRTVIDRVMLVLDDETNRPLKVVGIVQDITEHKEAADKQATLEAQLRQAQKMESIGRLAGGVAHDFNNQLAVIKLYSDLMRNDMNKHDPLLPKLEQIRRAVDRSADLTRQLLAFSRKQILKPVVLNVNELVTNLEKMLGRLIGDDVILSTNLQPDLWSVMADAGQLEQVIMNVVINARDALPTGGMITVETRNVYVDGQTISVRQDLPVGSFVMLAITDTGIGMDEDTRRQIFEPFFTTKQPGKGTGLGLATVHGIVKQSGGAIYVYSEPGQGTTFKIYLPVHWDEGGPHETSATSEVTETGQETILLVEDESALRELIQLTLAEIGYTVLDAQNGEEALAVAKAPPARIDLLLSDVVLPQMSGREIAEEITAVSPATRVLFMSGYMDDAVMRHGVLMADVNFISKPFSRRELTKKVRDVLHKPM